MIKFLLKGIFRDRHRSLLPYLVISLGVMLTVIFHAWMTGVIRNSIEFNARFSTGHVKIMTRAYAENASQSPIDLAVLGIDTLASIISREVPEMDFAQRIYFAGIIDVPDKSGETKAQGPAMGIGIDMLSGNLSEIERLNISASLKDGRMPEQRKEALLSKTFADKLGINTGDTMTLVSSSMYGEFTLYNFILCGTVEFGTTALDRGTIIADINDVREALNMTDAAGEILGFLRTGNYDNELSTAIADRFNRHHSS
jgi:putative ABC transport system permease protein